MKPMWILLTILLAAPLGFGQDSTRLSSTRNAAFPEIHDWNSLRITLSRSGCYGVCPTYSIEIYGDGGVLYDGQAFVGTTGKQKWQISHASLVKLVEAFH